MPNSLRAHASRRTAQLSCHVRSNPGLSCSTAACCSDPPGANWRRHSANRRRPTWPGEHSSPGLIPTLASVSCCPYFSRWQDDHGCGILYQWPVWAYGGPGRQDSPAESAGCQAPASLPVAGSLPSHCPWRELSLRLSRLGLKWQVRGPIHGHVPPWRCSSESPSWRRPGNRDLARHQSARARRRPLGSWNPPAAGGPSGARP